jgi:LysM repeat protein
MPDLYRALALVALVVAWLTGVPASAEAKPKKSSYTLIPGDNLWDLSNRFGVAMGDLERWNPRIFKQGKGILLPGAKLTVYTDSAVRQPREGSYAIQAGDNLGRIAKKVGVTVRHLLTVNNEVDPNALKVGQKLSYFTVPATKGGKAKAAASGSAAEGDDDGTDSQSEGYPNHGRLRNGEALVSAVGLRVKSPEESYGTNEVVEALFTCGSRYHKTFPKAAGMLIGDIAKKGGGRMSPHKSHQNGLDVDIGHARLGKHASDTQFTSLPPSTIDVKRTWAFLRCLLDSKRVARVYMNASVQRVFREAALKKQIDIAPFTVDTLFEYGSNTGGNAIIQAIGGHVNHFHVRFRCDPDDTKCRDKDAVPNT